MTNLWLGVIAVSVLVMAVVQVVAVAGTRRRAPGLHVKDDWKWTRHKADGARILNGAGR